MIPRGKGYRILVVAVMTLWLSSLQEVCAGTLMPWSKAREVVREAYRMHGEGKAYEDSVSLAQAYTELNKWKYLFPTDYVRACYYYGRWLRENEHPVLSMQVLLDATHVRTKDYIILGRVYSNIGTMCRMANCYDLAYEIFQRSNACFLQARDTTLYYYGLNNLAVETALQQDIRQTRILLDSIKRGGIEEVCLKTRETEVILYNAIESYDSVIVCVDHLQEQGYRDATGYLLKAIAYEHIGLKDSALTYARYVSQTTQEAYYLISAYYILSHYNTHLGIDSILYITSLRADYQKTWTLSQKSLAQAVQLLQEDLERRPNLGWLYAIIGTILFVSTGLSIYIVNRKRKNALLAQQIKRQRQEHEDLLAQTQSIQQAEAERLAAKQEQIENICHALRHSPTWRTDMDWENYDGLCTKMNALFYQLANKLKDKGLNRTEVRVCMLVLMQFSESAIAETLPYAKSGVGKLKHITAKKLGTTISKLRDFLISACL